jgi:hypothetical protein
MEYANVDIAKTPNRQSRATETFCNAIVASSAEIFTQLAYIGKESDNKF